MDEALLAVFTSGSWAPLSIQSASTFGINTTSSLPNRLAVKSDAVLFFHDDVSPSTGDIRHMLNRDGSANTGSLIFQTGYDAGAELGLIGSDDFKIRTSPDGATFATGLTVAAADGAISFPAGFASPANVQTSLELRSSLGTISDDSVSDADFGRTVNGSVIIAVPNYLGSAPVVIFFARMATSPNLVALFSNGPAFTTQTGELTGTTGEDGKIHFSVTSDGRFLVENRRGFAIGYTIFSFLR